MITRLIRKVLGFQGKPAGPCILPVAEHGIQRQQISGCALKTTRTLRQAGYAAFIVGGAVRDLLLGREPKDFDVATDATPEDIRRLFRRSRVIGRRFQIVHVYCGNETIEVTTFRAGQPDQDDAGEAGEADSDRVKAEDGMLLRDNVFGTQEEDAARRDFTVNALYYDPETEEVWDNHGGVADARARLLRIIGDPDTRYREDPVRMLRAARFAAKLDFHIAPETRAPIARLAPMLERIPTARLFDEMMKLLLSGHAERGVHQLRAEGLHHGTLPMLDAILDDPKRRPFLHAALHDTDERIRQGHGASPAFMLACLMWFDMGTEKQRLEAAGKPPMAALFEAMDQTLERQRANLAFPRRFDGMIKEIWSLQPRFEQRSGSRPYRLLTHPRFRASYDFLELRARGGDTTQELADWWHEFQDAGEERRATMLQPALAGDKRPRRRRRRKPNTHSSQGPEDHALTPS